MFLHTPYLTPKLLLTNLEENCLIEACRKRTCVEIKGLWLCSIKKSSANIKFFRIFFSASGNRLDTSFRPSLIDNPKRSSIKPAVILIFSLFIVPSKKTASPLNKAGSKC